MIAALLSTTLVGLAAAAVLAHLAGQWWPDAPKARAGVRLAAALVLVLCVLLHPIINRALFQPVADRKQTAIEASLGQPVDDLLARVGPPVQTEPMVFGRILSFRLPPWYLRWPKHERLDVLIVDGIVTQVGNRATPTQEHSEPPKATDTLEPPAAEPD